MKENIKLFDLETKENFIKELKRSIFENRVDIDYIIDILDKYDIDLIAEISSYDEGKEFILEKESFIFKKDENGQEILKITLGNEYNKINIETRNKHKILEILEEFLDICIQGYEEHKKGKTALIDFFEDI